jgi:hypothetical protein
VRQRGAEGSPEGDEGPHRGADLRHPGDDSAHFGAGDRYLGGAVATSVPAIRTQVRASLPGVREILTWVTKVRIRLEKDRTLKGRLALRGEGSALKWTQCGRSSPPLSLQSATRIPASGQTSRPRFFWRAGSWDTDAVGRHGSAPGEEAGLERAQGEPEGEEDGPDHRYRCPRRTSSLGRMPSPSASTLETIPTAAPSLYPVDRVQQA